MTCLPVAALNLIIGEWPPPRGSATAKDAIVFGHCGTVSACGAVPGSGRSGAPLPHTTGSSSGEG